jgi:hypothetical protein
MVHLAARGLRGIQPRGRTYKESVVDITELAPVLVVLVFVIWGKRW